MKSVVSFQASTLPAALSGKRPIIMKRVGNTTTLFSNKKDLTDFVDSKGTLPDADVYLMVTCQCKKVYAWQKNDVPDTTFTCECGRSVVQYGN